MHVQARRFRPTLAWRTLSDVVNGKRQPTIEVVNALAQALDTDPSYLLDLPDEEQATGGRAELAPEVATLAQRIDDLPEGLRAQVVGLVDQTLALVEDQLSGVALSAGEKLMLAYFDQLNDQNQAVALAELQRMLAEPHGDAGGQRDAQGTS